MRRALESALLGVLGGLFSVLPRGVSLALGRQLGTAAYFLASKRRQLALRNLDKALGKEIPYPELKNSGIL